MLVSVFASQVTETSHAQGEGGRHTLSAPVLEQGHLLGQA